LALTPEEEELDRKKAVLVGLEAQLADRELELASFRADLIHFEKRYLQTVGRRYATLDELKAQIAEARARQDPDRQDARDQARLRGNRAGRTEGATRLQTRCTLFREMKEGDLRIDPLNNTKPWISNQPETFV